MTKIRPKKGDLVLVGNIHPFIVVIEGKYLRVILSSRAYNTTNITVRPTKGFIERLILVGKSPLVELYGKTGGNLWRDPYHDAHKSK